MSAKTTETAVAPKVALTRVLSKSAMRNLVELAQEAPSVGGRSHWAGLLAREVNYTAR